MLIDLLVDVAALIEVTVALEKVAVSPREPAATDKCDAAYVWGSQIFDSPIGVQERGNEAGCFFRRAYEIRYRIDVCDPPRDDGREHTTSDMGAKADEFYTYADDVWCAIAHAASDGTLFDPPNTTKCEDIVVGPINFSGQADRISAEGSIRVTHPCSPQGS